ncbi:MAG TPA: FmdB family transcriptional regulator [Opitutaceae bacterium]
MPIYEYYCPDNHTVYQFYAKTLAQGQTVPRCPDNADYRMQKLVSAFAITSGGKKAETAGEAGAPDAEAGADPAEDARMEAAMGAMEQEFASVDENDPRAMGRMMRRMAELTGEKIDGEMEEVVRKLEEGADPESLDEQFGGADDEGGMDDPYGGMGGMGGEAPPTPAPKEGRHRFKARRQAPPRRDPKLYDYE